MKLLFVIPSITNYFTFLEELANVLVEKGVEVHLATSRQHIARIDSYRRGVRCTVHHIDLPRALSPIRHLLAARKIDRLVKKVQPDFISIHFSAALFTAMLGKKSYWPVSVGTIHGLGSPLINGWRKLAISEAEKWSAQRVDELFVLTEDDKVYLSKKARKAKVSKLSSFGMGCNIDRFHPENIKDSTREQLRSELGIAESDFVFIFIGRQTHFKGFDKVVLAFLLLRQQYAYIKLLLIGEKDRIHPTSKTKGFENRLKACPDIIRVGWTENVEEYLSIAHLNVFPSEREGLPVNLMESLAMGVPVITANSRGCREVVRNNVDGIVLDQNNIKTLSSAMERLLLDKKERLRLSENALKDRDRFSRQHFIQGQLDILKRYDCF